MNRLSSTTRAASFCIAAVLGFGSYGCSFIRDFDDFEGAGACVGAMQDCESSVAGCETLVSTSRDHCGGCGIQCGDTQFCEGSICRDYLGELAITATTDMDGLSAPLVAPGRNDGMFLAFNHATALTIGTSAAVPAANPEVLVTRVNAAGAQNWAVGMNGLGVETVSGMARRSTPEGVVLAGGFTSLTASYADTAASTHTATNLDPLGTLDGFVWALDEAGAYAWDLRFGGLGTTTVQLVTTDGNGNTYVAGIYTNGDLRIGTGAGGTNVWTVASGAPMTGLFVTKILPNGAPMWTRLLDAPVAALESLAVDPSGNVYLFSTSSGTINIPPSTTSVGNDTPRLIALSAATGVIAWFQAYESAAPSAEGAAGVVVIPGGDVYLAFHADNQSGIANVGISRGTVLVGIDPLTGAADATKVHELGDAFLPHTIASDSSGQIVLGTTVTGSSATTITVGASSIPHNPSTGRDVGIFGFSPDGAYQWARLYGTSGDDDLGSVAISGEGSVFVGGAFNLDFNIGTLNVDYVGSLQNAYAIRLGPQ